MMACVLRQQETISGQVQEFRGSVSSLKDVGDYLQQTFTPTL
jgi:hypothetical protein